jgi:hypothetical protein
MKPTTKEEKILKEGLEKASENQDNSGRISYLAFWHRIGYPPWAGSKPADLIDFSKEDSFFIRSIKSARVQSSFAFLSFSRYKVRQNRNFASTCYHQYPASKGNHT